MIAGTHPDGLKCPPAIAIASHIIRAWAEAGRRLPSTRSMARHPARATSTCYTGRRHDRTASFSLRSSSAAAQAHAAGVRIESVETYEGMCEASGAVALPEGQLRRPFPHAQQRGQHPPHLCGGHAGCAGRDDIGIAIASPRGTADRIDVEAATWLDGQAILVGSLGAERRRRVRDADWQFLSVAVEGDDTVRATSGRSDKLLAALAALDEDFAAAIGDLEDDPGLSPKQAGINLEGMSVTADGASLFLGFRNPVPTDNRSSSSSSTRSPSCSRMPSRLRAADPARPRRARHPEPRIFAGGGRLFHRRRAVRLRRATSTSTAGSRAPTPSGSRRARGARLPRRLRAGGADHRPDGEAPPALQRQRGLRDRHVPERDPDAGMRVLYAAASSRSTTLSCSFGSVRAITALAGAAVGL